MDQHEDLNPIDFSMCLLVYRYVKTYPYRLPGAGLAILGVALVVSSVVTRAETS
ncbi:MAG: hypothetical protein ACETWE_02935 [Candidatus Bathyarchaeia archaeon]